MDTKNGLEFETQLTQINEKIDDLNEAILSFEEEEQEPFSREIRDLRESLGALVRRRYSNLSPWQRVSVARHPDRPQVPEYLDWMVDEVIELHGDRSFRNDPSLLGAFVRIEGRRMLFLGQCKGKTNPEKFTCNFGSSRPEAYRKAMRLMKLAAKFKLPILTFINTPGADPGIGAEERGQSQAIAESLRCMSQLPVPILCITIGEGGSGGALGIGVGDRTLILEHAYYSVISPEGCAEILWRDIAEAPNAAAALRITAEDLLDLQIVDEIIPEPEGGAHRNPKEMAMTLKAAVIRHLDELNEFSPEQLIENRYQRLRAIGKFVNLDES